MNLEEKLIILANSAKYDASCSSSGSNRSNKNNLGNTHISGICHSFSNDGRCISLLKILMTNICIYDCKYCINRNSNNVKRTFFTPEEICSITLNFYKRNFIEGLFLSSGVLKSPDYTMEKLIETIYLLRNKYKFNGYIHAKTIPGASPHLIKKLGYLVDRLSCNIELPSENDLKLLAPDKKSDKITKAFELIKENKSQKFSPAGQSTQMIIGASKESDYKIMTKSEFLYQNYDLKRVYYSAYIPVNNDKLLPSINTPSPLVRENRLYQADWLLRFYGFKTDDILDENNPNFNILLDPKCDWALRHLSEFPKEINKVNYLDLLKIPGIGLISAKKIMSSRKYFNLDFDELKKLGVSMKRAKYFITCNGKYFTSSDFFKKDFITANLVLEEKSLIREKGVQLSLFNDEKR